MGVRTAPTIQASLVSAYAIWSSAPFGYERLPFANAFEVPGEVLRPEHVALHPYSEPLVVVRWDPNPRRRSCRAGSSRGHTKGERRRGRRRPRPRPRAG